MIQGLILAAGRGSRMSWLTKDKPKCMIKLLGKSILEWQIEAMKKEGVSEIYLVGGYQIDVLKRMGYPWIENLLWHKTNMVESLRCASEILRKKETIISYADICCISEIFRLLKNDSSDIAITYDIFWKKLWKERFKNPLENAETFSIRNGKLIDIGRPPTNYYEIQGQYMGLIKVTPKGWKSMEALLNTLDTRTMDVTTFLQIMVQKGIPIQGVPVLGKWCEIDSPEDLKCYEKKLNSKTPWTHDWRS